MQEGGVELVMALQLGHWWWSRVEGSCRIGVVGHYYKKIRKKDRKVV